MAERPGDSISSVERLLLTRLTVPTRNLSEYHARYGCKSPEPAATTFRGSVHGRLCKRSKRSTRWHVPSDKPPVENEEVHLVILTACTSSANTVVQHAANNYSMSDWVRCPNPSSVPWTRSFVTGLVGLHGNMQRTLLKVRTVNLGRLEAVNKMKQIS